MSASMTLQEARRVACAKLGVVDRDVPVDGKWYPADIEGDKRGRGDARIKHFPDGQGGYVHNWKANAGESFFADDGRQLNETERWERDKRRAEARREAQEEAERRRTEASIKAASIWKEASPAQPDHPYLVRKQVQPVTNLRELAVGDLAMLLGYVPRSSGEELAGRIIVAPVNIGARLSTLEFIDEVGRKSALAGGEKGGGYWCAQELPSGDGTGLRLLIAEGIATALSAQMATGHPVIAALSCSNLEPVARTMRERYPAATLIVLGDLGNGQSDAERAARGARALLALPRFDADRPEDATDFNDLHQHAGVDAVRLSIEQAPDQPSSGAPADGPAMPSDWRATVQRLAKLPLMEYELVRKAEAEQLGIDRVTTLDAEVARARGVNETICSGQALTFPDIEPWTEPVAGADVLTEIRVLCGRFLQLPKHVDTIVPLWVALTYVTEAFDVLPLLFITAPEKGCGKTTVLDLVSRLCARPLPASNISGPGIFRTIEVAHPTLLLDEADSFLSENEQMRGIINSGHSRSNAFVIRVAGENHEPRKFSTWCAKAVAGIGRLPGTIEDRALIVTMQRLAPGEKVEKLRRIHSFPDLCRKLTRWANDHQAALQAARPTLPDALSNRAADNWEPLFAIADAVGGDWPARVEDAARTLTGNSQPSDGVGIELLRDIRAAFNGEEVERLRTAQLIELLVADDTARWADYSHGRPISSAQIAKILRRYGISPGSIRVGDATAKGYMRAQFTDVFRRYLSDLPQTNASPAVTPSQAHKNQAFNDCSSRHISEGVTAAASPQILDSEALLRRDGSKTHNPEQDATRWRIRL